jgi:hypothetical protein
MAIKYSPIDEEIDIRLVKLDPGNLTDPIYCTLHFASFSANSQYQALSYTWGKATDGFKRIYIDGEAVEVRANLYEALKSLRQPSGPERHLWIDSLCINQADDQERSQQVGRMSEIYSQAEEVLIWLGNECGNSDLAMGSIRKISALASGTAETPKERTLIADYRRHRAAWAAIGKLCQRGYWQRMWIIQEVQLARELYIYCGGRSASWNALKDTLDLVNRCLACKDLAEEKILLDIANSLAARLESHRLKRESHGSTLKELLHDCRDSLCTDQRDKIYALVGLASDCQDGQLGIDYSKSLAQVYKDVMKLYSLHGFGDWESQEGRDVVRFSYFLQNLLQPHVGQQVKLSINLTTQDSEPVWLVGFPTSTILRTRQPYSKAALKMSASMTRKIYTLTDEMFLAVKDRIPRQENLLEGISALSQNSADVTAAEIQQVLLDNGQSAIAPLEAIKGDLICQFVGYEMAGILRFGSRGWRLVGSALFLENSDFNLCQPIYLRLNFIVLQRITAH